MQFDVSIIPRFLHKGTTISMNGKSTLSLIYYFGGSEICRLPNFSLSKIKATERFKNRLNDRLSSRDLSSMLFFGTTISSVVYLRCRMQIQAKPMNRKRFWSCLLSNGERKLVQMRAEPSLLELCRVQPSFCKLLQTVYRLTFSYSKRGLATFASDKRR